MKKVSIISAEEAALKVQDGDTIATGGFVSCACPETLSKALEKRFLETGHPKDLTLFFAAGQGHRDGTGGDHYGPRSSLVTSLSLPPPLRGSAKVFRPTWVMVPML